MDDDRFLYWVIIVPVVVGVLALIYWLMYQECLETGLSPEQCRFIVCSGG